MIQDVPLIFIFAIRRLKFLKMQIYTRYNFINFVSISYEQLDLYNMNNLFYKYPGETTTLTSISDIFLATEHSFYSMVNKSDIQISCEDPEFRVLQNEVLILLMSYCIFYMQLVFHNFANYNIN